MIKLLILILIFSAFVMLIAVKNDRRSKIVDRKINRKAKEAERRESDRIYEMKQRNIQLRKFSRT